MRPHGRVRGYACFGSTAEVYRWADHEVGKRLAGRAGDNARLAVFYEKDRMEGTSLTIFGSGPCDSNSDWDFEYGNLTPDGWDNKISSFQGYSNCEIKLFEHDNANADKTGRTFGTVSTAYIIGSAMNDQASSVRFY